MSLGRQGHASSSACKVAPSSAFLSSPKGRHSRLSYRRVFFLCSLSIRINGAPIEMTSLNRLTAIRSEEHTSELQSLMRLSYAVFCLKKTKYTTSHHNTK